MEPKISITKEPKIPSGYKDLYSASTRINTCVNLIGVVTDARAPCKTQGTDWVCTFSISDPTYNESEEGLQVRFFRLVETELPKIQGTGDVVILRNINIRKYRGSTMALAGNSTSWAVFVSGSIPEKAPPEFELAFVKDPRAPAPMLNEMEYAIFLCNSRDRSTFRKISESYPSSADVLSSHTGSIIQASAPQLSRDKFSTIKDVQVDNFYDLVGQVVKIYPSNNGNVELYITDYTSHSELYNYVWGCPAAEDVSSREGDEFGYAPRNSANGNWPGPFGRLTLTVLLFPDHSYFAQSNVKENHFVYLRNVLIRKSKDRKKVEGRMHTENKYAGRVNISIIKDHGNDDRVKHILRRKLEYSEKFKVQSQRFINEARGQKRKLENGGKQMSKAQAKRQRKQQREQALRPQSKEQGIERAEENNAENVVVTPKPSKQVLNKNIRCSHTSIPTRPLSSILSLETHEFTTPKGTSFTLPFQNIQSRTTVRVIDFFPPDIADFAVPCPPPSEYDALSEHEASDSPDPEGDCQADKNHRWEWRFSLVIEEAKGSKHEEKAKMKVYVADQDADFLLKLDAEDLRASPNALNLLRERLFVLWGDLEELKSKLKLANLSDQNQEPAPAPAPQPKSMPFECCLKEYGIRKIRDKAKANIASVDEEGDESEIKSNQEENFGWERRWRLWGTTIV